MQSALMLGSLWLLAILYMRYLRVDDRLVDITQTVSLEFVTYINVER